MRCGESWRRQPSPPQGALLRRGALRGGLLRRGAPPRGTPPRLPPAPGAAAADTAAAGTPAADTPAAITAAAGRASADGLISSDGQYSEWVDQTVPARADFFRFANGRWIKANP